MSFWNTSDNKKVDASGEFESGGSIEPMPEGTQVVAAPLEAGWASYEEDEYINIQWVVLAPEEYKNRRVFQKVRVLDSDPKKADKAKRMLAAIDANAGGKLLASGEAPTDQSLTQHLVNKPMMLKLGLWKMDTENGERTGNWVQAVAPKNSSGVTRSETTEKETAPKSSAPAKDQEGEDDIPW